MEFESLRWISILSIIANILFIVVLNHLYKLTKVLMLGGLWGVEKTAGNNPNLDKGNLNAYLKFCHNNYNNHVVSKRSKGSYFR